MIAELILAAQKPAEFEQWLKSLEENNCAWEAIINEGYIMRVNVDVPDNGDWSDLEYGRVQGSGGLRFKQKVFQPAMLGNKFTVNYDGKREKA